MTESLLDDYRWLIADEAAPWLAEAADPQQSLVTLTSRLRAKMSPRRAHLVLEQAESRRRGRAKFRRADEMFFTPVALEQATGEPIARYKAARFVEDRAVYDLCCGIGGDLLELGRRGAVTGVDRNAVAALLAAANCRIAGLGEVRVETADVAEIRFDRNALWHIDPDRRPGGRRTTQPDLHQPGVAAIDNLLKAAPSGAIKLAPAAVIPPPWEERGELEWIGHDRECKQLIVWLGDLASQPGRRCATILGQDGRGRTLVGQASAALPQAASIDRFVFEPHAAVLAARLTGSLALAHGLCSFSPQVAYLTGDRAVADPALAAFEVVEVMPLDVKKIRGWLRARQIGRLEVKQRGVDQDPENVRHKLRVPGEHAATLILAPFDGRVTAIIAKRVDAT